MGSFLRAFPFVRCFLQIAPTLVYAAPSAGLSSLEETPSQLLTLLLLDLDLEGAAAGEARKGGSVLWMAVNVYLHCGENECRVSSNRGGEQESRKVESTTASLRGGLELISYTPPNIRTRAHR
jgi:hypothetical protein